MFVGRAGPAVESRRSTSFRAAVAGSWAPGSAGPSGCPVAAGRANGGISVQKRHWLSPQRAAALATIRDMTSVPDRARVRLPGISSRAYEHPLDRSALVALRKLFGFDT